jgi:putative glycerol-1-phosphate prenyltransferase
MNIFDTIKSLSKGIAILIDPDKFKSNESLKRFLNKIKLAEPDFIFIGGSAVSKFDFDRCVQMTKLILSIPIVLFPGASHHLSREADALLFLSLISGRNPDFLIGQHVEAIDELVQMDIETIATSYLLIDGGKMTSVQYVSRTQPIPQDEISIARKTALAGKHLGQKLIYADAGSGALHPISSAMIQSLSKVNSPLIIGGGLRSIESIQQAHKSGANLVVVGNKLEEDIDFLLDLKSYMKA